MKKMLAFIITFSFIILSIGCESNQTKAQNNIPVCGEVIGYQIIESSVATMRNSELIKIKDTANGNILYVLIGGDGRGSIAIESNKGR